MAFRHLCQLRAGSPPPAKGAGARSWGGYQGVRRRRLMILAARIGSSCKQVRSHITSRIPPGISIPGAFGHYVWDFRAPLLGALIGFGSCGVQTVVSWGLALWLGILPDACPTPRLGPSSYN